jgi:hypothetical protein
LKRKLAQDAAARERGEAGAWTNGRRSAKRTPIEHLEWLHKPLAWVQPTDIEEYVHARVEVVASATADRELDLLSAMFNGAIKTWRYEVPRSPMEGVRCNAGTVAGWRCSGHVATRSYSHAVPGRKAQRGAELPNA